MAVDAELASWVALAGVNGLGDQSLRRLLQAFGSPEAVFAAPAHLLREHVKPAVAERIAQRPDQDEMDTLAAWLEAEGNSIITLADADYPSSLLNIADPPPLLYAKGDRSLLKRPALAVVGSRNSTAQGIGHAEAFSEAISAAGLCIISGMAHGIDSAAHRGGLRGRGERAEDAELAQEGDERIEIPATPVAVVDHRRHVLLHRLPHRQSRHEREDQRVAPAEFGDFVLRPAVLVEVGAHAFLAAGDLEQLAVERHVPFGLDAELLERAVEAYPVAVALGVD